jgi:hypothetical protein
VDVPDGYGSGHSVEFAVGQFGCCLFGEFTADGGGEGENGERVCRGSDLVTEGRPVHTEQHAEPFGRPGRAMIRVQIADDAIEVEQ